MNAIVNFANSNGNYKSGQARLMASLVNKFDGAIHAFTGEESIGAPLHSDNPYAFKLYAIEKLRDQGYKKILFLDASVMAVKNVQPVFDWLTDKEIFFEECGNWVGNWCNEQTLSYFGITREQAMSMPMYSAGFSGFDFDKAVSTDFFARWKRSMLDGMFRGSWSDHRHDMTCGSIIANQMGLVDRYSPGGNFFAYVGSGYGEPRDSVVFHVAGL